jgi:hypothetical protein
VRAAGEITESGVSDDIIAKGKERAIDAYVLAAIVERDRNKSALESDTPFTLALMFT